MSMRSLAAVAALVMVAPAVAGAETRVALLPVAVHAAGSDSEYLQTGLAEMISARLEQYDGLEVVRPSSAVTPASAREDALARGREAGADFVLYGSFTRFGEGASLDLRCDQVLSAEEVGSDETGSSPDRRVFIQAGTLAEIIPDLDTLAEKVARFAMHTPQSPPLRAEAAAAQAQAPGPSAAQYQEILKRLDALERALYPPVAQGEPPTAKEPAPEPAPSVVR